MVALVLSVLLPALERGSGTGGFQHHAEHHSAAVIAGRNAGADYGFSGVGQRVGYLVGGVEIGAIAGVFGNCLASGINAGVGLLLPVIWLTPLVWRPVESYEARARATA